MHEPLGAFHSATRAWFEARFGQPSPAQREAWPALAQGESALVLAPTGSGKTLAAFLDAIDRLLFPRDDHGAQVLYVSPLKALATDIEANLAAPVVGIREAAYAAGHSPRALQVAVRTGDTPATERRRQARSRPDIWVTTPESLYLMLTSQTRHALSAVDTVIVDEIHALAPTKRGSHLLLSLERLEELRAGRPRPLQRIGLSATQHAPDTIAAYLGGQSTSGPRPVRVVDVRRPPDIDVRIHITVDDFDALPASGVDGESPASIWPSIHAYVLEQIRAHHSTMIFVNNRRLTERLTGAINELAGEQLAVAHHGSVARSERTATEQALRSGELRAIVSTSSLELGLDLGAVDLVLLVECPSSVASALQRIGRANHRVGGRPKARLVPTHRGDLLAMSALLPAVLAGEVEPSALPTCPLDVLAQQLLAMLASGPARSRDLFELVRRAFPFRALARESFDGVLVMLEGGGSMHARTALRARVTWQRETDLVTSRPGLLRLVALQPGTIPDRGNFPVYLDDEHARGSRRVGELDEEFVFESRVGEAFWLGTMSWTITAIEPHAVRARPAPGRAAKMPFWRGDGAGRPLESALRIGALQRRLDVALERGTEPGRIADELGLEDRLVRSLVQTIGKQRDAGAVPTDERIVIERFPDELGDSRVVILGPFGRRVHATLALALGARADHEGWGELDPIWTDEGLVLRVAARDESLDLEGLLPAAGDLDELVRRALPSASLFTLAFRENAHRALLLTRRHANARQPLWAQRRQALDLLRVARDVQDFPIVLETLRECLDERLDVPGTRAVLDAVGAGRIRVSAVERRSPSPFAARVLFSYVANFLYEADAPLADRRAQALALEPLHLESLLGTPDYAHLLDPLVIDAYRRERRTVRGPSTPLAVHDLLRRVGPMARDRLSASFDPPNAEAPRHAAEHPDVLLVGEDFVAREDLGPLAAARRGDPRAILEVFERALTIDGPTSLEDVVSCLSLDGALVAGVVRERLASGRWIRGRFEPGVAADAQVCRIDVLDELRSRSLARARRAITPCDVGQLQRFLLRWHGLVPGPSLGLEEALTAVATVGLPLEDLERHILPARVRDFARHELDALLAGGRWVWRGVQEADTKIALHPADGWLPPAEPLEDEVEEALVLALRTRGASFFAPLVSALGRFPPDVARALQRLTWKGWVTNDTLAPLRSLVRAPLRDGPFARRPTAIGGTEGRWSLLERAAREPNLVEAATAWLEREGILTRDGVRARAPDLERALESMTAHGRVLRGPFVGGAGPTQYASPSALRELRADRPTPGTCILAAMDPAQPYGRILPWPERLEGRASRTSRAVVLVVDGLPSVWVSPTGATALSLRPQSTDELSAAAQQLSHRLRVHVREITAFPDGVTTRD